MEYVTYSICALGTTNCRKSPTTVAVLSKAKSEKQLLSKFRTTRSLHFASTLWQILGQSRKNFQRLKTTECIIFINENSCHLNYFKEKNLQSRYKT